jgi:hypothetical protein
MAPSVLTKTGTLAEYMEMGMVFFLPLVTR